ncbi:phosphoserine phosphatase SerB [Leptospira ryugenii]|uniref:Phosphoserine phosphatase n=1 Tax=Leptospira ryugenii TaxID=1917863 RepID=A0A2P2DZU2_9LEPT|nr:phosphoserine phosphatase SerB [Leptospira ryugenii]GBF50151.1 phosphoserine phosphatase SerB [Leptospira ryugenii]
MPFSLLISSSELPKPRFLEIASAISPATHVHFDFQNVHGQSAIRWEWNGSSNRSELLKLREVAAKQKLDYLEVDNLISPNESSVFCFDMDSTVIQEEVIDELARRHGVFEEVARVTKEAMEGGISFDEALRKRVKLLQGLSRQSFQEVYESLHLNPGMDVLFEELPKHKSKIIILSGGFQPILTLFAKKYPISFFKANELQEENGHFTGEILGEIINKEKKAFYLKEYVESHKIPTTQTVGVGDGANDGLMLRETAIGIGFHAKQGLKDQIKNWIQFSDMRALLFLFSSL